jgi:hypothetical protein
VPIRRLLITAAILLMHGQSAKALLLWNWCYSGAGVSASGAFTTNDAPDAAGFYRIVGITGTDNGATITGLQPTGTPIPGNEPFSAAIVPEPSAASLMLAGLVGLIGFGRIQNIDCGQWSQQSDRGRSIASAMPRAGVWTLAGRGTNYVNQLCC